MNTLVLEKPFAMLLMALEIRNLSQYDLLSVSESAKLNEIISGILTIQPRGKIGDLYKTKNNFDIEADLNRYMDIDDRRELEMFKVDFYLKCENLYARINHFIEVFEPLVKKLVDHHVNKLEIIKGAING